METISAVDGTAKAESWGIKKGSVLYIKPNDAWVIPASRAGFAHLLVVPCNRVGFPPLGYPPWHRFQDRSKPPTHTTYPWGGMQ